MAETQQDPKDNQTTTTEGGDGNPEEEAFWKKFDERIDSGIKRNIDAYRKNAPTGTSRTGRTTLPGILANLVFGPAPKD